MVENSEIKVLRNYGEPLKIVGEIRGKESDRLKFKKKVNLCVV